MYSISICDSFEKSRKSLEKNLMCFFKAKDVLVRIRNFEKLADMVRLSAITDIVFINEGAIDREGIEYVQNFLVCHPNVYLYILGDKYKLLDDAMDLHVFRYLDNPVDLDRLYLSLNMILESQKEIKFTSQYMPITLKEDEVVCVYSYDRKTYVLSDVGVVYPTTMSMKVWAEKLKGLGGFSQPHYSYIINMRFIYDLEDKSILLRCKNGQSVKVTPSQRRLENFRDDYYKRIKRV